MKCVCAVLVLSAIMLLAGCSSPSAPTSTAVPGPKPVPGGYPPIPRPSSPTDIIQPDTSEIYTTIKRLAGGDFCPVVKDALGSWRRDVVTSQCNVGIVAEDHATWYDVWGASFDWPPDWPVKVRDSIVPWRIILMENAQPVAPRHFKIKDAWHYCDEDLRSCLLLSTIHTGWAWWVPCQWPFDSRKFSVVTITLLDSKPLTNPVFLRRDRFWLRVPIDGKKSIQVDPGATFEVSYTWTRGVEKESSSQWAWTFSWEVGGSLGKENVAGLNGKISKTTGETFSTSVSVNEESSSEVTRALSGIEGKTVIYANWHSIERYTFTDQMGNPYTDPSYVFENGAPLIIRGEYEYLSSTQFNLAK